MIANQQEHQYISKGLVELSAKWDKRGIDPEVVGQRFLSVLIAKAWKLNDEINRTQPRVFSISTLGSHIEK
jgi:hypothetical protein